MSYNARAFVDVERRDAGYRDIESRRRDYAEVEVIPDEALAREQAGRCMDCGIPFCSSACPLGNRIPRWNTLTRESAARAALAALQSTNNFPEFTGRVCPAPCETGCVAAIGGEAVAIRSVELALVERGWEQGWIEPQPSLIATGKRVAVVGSGPAGLAAAQQLARIGHAVTVYERDAHPGGLLRYGIPDFKLDKTVIERRLRQLEAEGVRFVTSVALGKDITLEELERTFDATVICVGAAIPRDLPIDGRHLRGVDFAVPFLAAQNRRNAGEGPAQAHLAPATGQRVVVIGGGDTGSDCVGTALRQRATNVTSLELMPPPPAVRMPTNPWPEWPLVMRSSSSHEEGGSRQFGVRTVAFLGAPDGTVKGLRLVRVERRGGALVDVLGTDIDVECDRVLLAMGFIGADVDAVGLAVDDRGRVLMADADGMIRPGVFVAGDAARGQSLVVTAIASGRDIAGRVDRFFSSATVASANERG